MMRRAALADDVVALRFTNLDANGDGVVTKEEFLSAKQDAMPLLADTDGDGMISKDEVLRVISALPAFQ